MPPRERDPRVSRAFGRALKIARVRADMSRAAVAHEVGLLPAAIGRFERGEREPALSMFMRLARTLGVSTTNLLTATEQELRDGRPPGAPAAAHSTGTDQARPPVAMAIIVQDARVLMTRRRTKENVVGMGPTTLWSFPSGETEGAETPEDAAVRETMEEVGLRVRPVAHLGERVHPLSPTKRRFVYIACEIIGGTLTLVDHEELAELRWCTLAEAMEFVRPIGGFDLAVQEYLARVLVPAGAS